MILSDIKEMLAVPTAYEAFDAELLIHSRAALTEAFQMGLLLDDVTPDSILSLTFDVGWADIFRPNVITMAKLWLPMKIRKRWDPPQGAALTAVDSTIADMEGRMVMQVESEVLNQNE